MPDEQSAAPGTTKGTPIEEPDDRTDDGAREQGVRSERSEDLSSPQLTVPQEPRDDRD
jgi:hypothetical protein